MDGPSITHDRGWTDEQFVTMLQVQSDIYAALDDLRAEVAAQAASDVQSFHLSSFLPFFFVILLWALVVVKLQRK